MKKYVLMIVCLLTSLSSWAYIDYKTGTITYRIYDTATTPYAAVYQDSSSVKTLSGTVDIPSTITYNETVYKVTHISYWRYGNKVKLVLPNSITNYSWSYIYALGALSLPSNTTSFNLGNIHNTIDTLYIPASTTTVTPSSDSSYGQNLVAEFKVVDENTAYKAVDGVLFSKDGSQLVCYPEQKDGVAYSVPDNVTSIGNYAFYYNNKLEAIVLPNSLTNIGDYSFYYCNNLYECQLPTSIKTIGSHAFSYASKYTICGDFSALSALTEIGDRAFGDYYSSGKCNFTPQNNTFTLPANLKTIGEYAFNYAFSNYSNVTVVFPSSLGESGSQIKVGNYAFNCKIIRAMMSDPVNSSNNAFSYVQKIYIPEGTLERYSSKTGWNYNTDILTVSTSVITDSSLVAPTITPILDSANSTVKVKFSTTTEDATIKYYVLESGAADVDVADWYTYNGKDSIDVAHGATAKAVTLKSGKYSTISQYTVDVNALKCPTPSIITTTNSTSMTMATSLEGGDIYYTTDGTTPSAKNGTKYTGQLTLDGNFTYNAVVVKEGMFNSEVASKDVTWFKCEQPTISYEAEKPDGSTVKVTISGNAKDKFQYYLGSGDWLDYPDGGVINVGQNSYFYARATRANYTNSNEINTYLYRSNITCTKPTIGIDQDAKTLTLTSDEGADIYYTLDGSTPAVKEELKYAGVITLTGNCQVYAIAHMAGKFQSDLASTNINNWFTCGDVTVTTDMVNGQAVVKLTTTTEGATIRYGVNGRDYYTPENNTEYSAPFGYSNGDRIYAIAMKEGYNNSGWTDTKVYYAEGSSQCAAPSIELDNEARLVTMTTTETNGVIYYTLDGSDPTTASTKYEAAFTSETNCTIRAITAREATTDDEGNVTTYLNSTISERNLDDWFRLESVKFHPVLGSADGEYKLALSAEEGTTIEYGFNQYGGNVYAKDTFAVSLGDWIYAIARADGRIESYWSEFRITESNYQVRQPSIQTNDVTHVIVATSETEGATIYYTSDGNDPDPASETTTKLEKDTIDIVRNGTYKFLAIKEHMTNSSISTVTIDWFRVPNVTITPFAEDNTLKVRLECKDEDGNDVPGVAIYYATNSDYDSENLSANAAYTEPFEIADGARVWASAQKSGYNNAYWTSTDWIYKSSYTATTPSITIAADTTVTISSTEEGATLYYTLDGSDPTTSSTKFTSKFKMTTNGTIKAIAAVAGKLNSGIRSRDYSGYSVKSITITPIVENNKLKIKLESETPGAQIYYNINEYNSSTIEANLPYSVPFEIPNDSYVYAIGTKDGYTNSGWTSKGWYYYSNYTCNEPTITITADTTCIMSAAEGASIYYTLNGDDPTTSSTLYTSGTTGFKLTSNVTIKAIAVQSGMMNSSIRERSYSSFRVANPVITNDGTTITITSDTPGATFKYCYEPDPRDDNGNLMYTRTYTGPFEALYNSYIYVQATKDGFNSSNGEFWVPNVVKCKPVEQVSYNGHSMKLKAEDGATIWYTVNGETPNDNSNGWYSYVYQYADSIEINSTGKVRAIATAQYKNQSDIADFEVTSFAGETGATSDKAGGLEASMGWSTPSTIKEFTITGPINASDISFVKNKMTSLEKLDLSNATIDDGNLPDNAFVGMPLLSFSSPNGIKSVGKNIFSNCDNLAAVVWNTTAKIPNDAFDADVNQNLLLFVPSQEAAPDNSSVRNIIVNGTAQNIYLGDGENNNFYCPQSFYAQNITYTHDFTLETGDGSGWETIALPFNCSRFVHESKGELKPFAAYNNLDDKASYKPFWLRELTDIGFNDVSQIEANKPYIISMPNNESYATRYRVGGMVTFSATDTWVPVTEPQAVQKGVNTLYANFLNDSDTDYMLLLNTEDTDEHKAGSIFVKNSGRAVRPFEAYVLSQANARAYISITRGFGDDPDGDEGTTAIKVVEPDANGLVKVYNLSGVLVKQGAKEDVLRGLAKGVYIMNGKRVIVK